MQPMWNNSNKIFPDEGQKILWIDDDDGFEIEGTYHKGKFCVKCIGDSIIYYWPQLHWMPLKLAKLFGRV